MLKSPFDIDFQNQHLPSKIVAGLERISEAFKVLLWKHAKEIGLSPIQIQILIFVRYHSEDICNVSALAKEFNLTKPTISDAVKVLSQKVLINKVPSTIDKRAYSIELTPEGEKIVSQTEGFSSPFDNLISSLPKEDQVKFFQTLNQLILGLNKAQILTVQRMCFNCRFYQKNQATHYCKLLEQKLEYQDIRLDCPEFDAKKED